MKGLFVIVILGVLHSAIATGGKCSCAVFLKSGSTNHPDMTTRVFSTEDKDADSCDDAGKTTCTNSCHGTIEKLTDGGKLSHKNKEGKSIADIACTRLNKDVTNGELGAFVKVCDADWVFTRGTTPQHLCCQNGHSIAC